MTLAGAKRLSRACSNLAASRGSIVCSRLETTCVEGVLDSAGLRVDPVAEETGKGLPVRR